MSKGAADTKSLVVKIAGDRYALKTERDPEHTMACAEHVDRTIKEVAISGRVSDPGRAAVLAALMITDQLFGTLADKDEFQRLVETRLCEIADHLEQLVES